LQVIKALIEKENYYLLLPDLEKIIQEVCFIEDVDDIHAMLDYYHDLGVIIKHGGTVVLQTQWLIDLFRKLITVRPYDDQVRLFTHYHHHHYHTLYQTIHPSKRNIYFSVLFFQESHV